ncbi:MAG: PepSY domain-containing protein [Acidobacteriota bacterium]
MTTRRLHRVIGLVMLLPLIGWAVTGAFFFLKPGYAGAYESLQVKTYPLEGPIAFDPDMSWLEVRVEKTILGEHLLARTSQGWLHLDPRSLQGKPEPSADEIRALLTDAFSANPARYGRVANVEAKVITTDTGVRVEMDWNRLALTQQGKDTNRIDAIYRIHYLQWTGVATVDKVLGALGILLLLALSALGARLFFSKG